MTKCVQGSMMLRMTIFDHDTCLATLRGWNVSACIDGVLPYLMNEQGRKRGWGRISGVCSMIFVPRHRLLYLRWRVLSLHRHNDSQLWARGELGSNSSVFERF